MTYNLVDDEHGAAFDLVVDSGDEFADEGECHEGNATEEGDEDDDRGEPDEGRFNTHNALNEEVPNQQEGEGGNGGTKGSDHTDRLVREAQDSIDGVLEEALKGLAGFSSRAVSTVIFDEPLLESNPAV